MGFCARACRLNNTLRRFLSERRFAQTHGRVRIKLGREFNFGTWGKSLKGHLATQASFLAYFTISCRKKNAIFFTEENLFLSVPCVRRPAALEATPYEGVPARRSLRNTQTRVLLRTCPFSNTFRGSLFARRPLSNTSRGFFVRARARAL